MDEKKTAKVFTWEKNGVHLQVTQSSKGVTLHPGSTQLGTALFHMNTLSFYTLKHAFVELCDRYKNCTDYVGNHAFHLTGSDDPPTSAYKFALCLTSTIKD